MASGKTLYKLLVYCFQWIVLPFFNHVSEVGSRWTKLFTIPIPPYYYYFFLIFCFQFFSLYLYPWSYAGFDSLKTKKKRCSVERKNCFFFLFALFLSIQVLYYPLTVNTMSPLQKIGCYSALPLWASEHHKKLLESFNLPAEKSPIFWDVLQQLRDLKFNSLYPIQYSVVDFFPFSSVVVLLSQIHDSWWDC